MKFISKIALFLYAAVFATSLSFAGPTSGVKHNWGSSEVERQQPQTHPANERSKNYGEIKLEPYPYIVAYLPKDIRSYQPLVFRCNEEGQRAKSAVGTGCLDYVSASTSTKWRVRFVLPGAGARIYRIRENEQLSLHVQFDANETAKATYASAEASRLAQVNGASPTQVAKEAPTPSQAPPQQQARADCDHLGFPQRIACEAANNPGLGAAIGAGVRALGK